MKNVVFKTEMEGMEKKVVIFTPSNKLIFELCEMTFGVKISGKGRKSKLQKHYKQKTLELIGEMMSNTITTMEEEINK